VIRARRGVLASFFGVAAIAVLITSPLAAGTTFSYPYKAAFSTQSSTTSGTGVTTYGPIPLAPTASSGTTVFWQNSSVGQLGPAMAEIELNQSFESGTFYSFSAGSHTFDVTWKYTGDVAFFSHCYSSAGAAELYANQSFENQLSMTTGGTTKWVPTTPVSASDYSYSFSSSCPTSTQTSYPFNGHSSTQAISLTISTGQVGNYYVWASLDTTTTALEPRTTDIIASSCINYELGSGGCDPTAGSGSALLVQVSFT
jgi:hypothetical protein